MNSSKWGPEHTTYEEYENIVKLVGVQVPVAVNMNFTLFWGVTPCN
jgi:hypothetical protein